MSDLILKKDLILFDIQAESDDIVIKQIAEILFKKGYVKESYIKAIREREDKFATGLPTETIGVAIPHTESEHVINQALALAILKDPIPFRVMGDHESYVDVKLIFMIAPSGNGHLSTLQKLMAIFEDKELLSKIVKATDSTEIINLFSAI
ncbi:PTS sugar transporter subunit IIA [Alkalibaculum sp. M08DMB]|uniref:PTS sugar transporter subunit IIA n=1 Tax=Alkalibaculum sporogenes TaxID=2655001 RepID=A0A6A7KC73_9FIRM|nr:PTS sugar transporter subunit IIA [Alkalibaculum sporogenes]MPW26996.1 PTS sugar transporter subunit IIA [Alkalibaculum sporogenes]